MNKPFDATMRNLIELEPAAWLRFLNIAVDHPERVEVKDSNLSTVSPEADRVFWIAEDPPWIEQVELQAGRDLGLPDRVHWYSTLLRRHYQVPVHSNVVLLRPAADGDDLTGIYEQKDRNGVTYDWFRYNIVRVWKRPVDEVLAAGLAVLPLAPVSDVGVDQLPDVLTAMARRLKAEAAPERAKHLWAATKILMGLYYPEEQIDRLTERISAMILGIRGIEESTVYQGIFARGKNEGKAEGRAEGKAEGRAEGKAEGRAEGKAEGRAEGKAEGRAEGKAEGLVEGKAEGLVEGKAEGLVEGKAEGLVEGKAEGLVEEARVNLLRLGRKKLGSPSADIEARIAGLHDVHRLHDLLDRLIDVTTWEELLSPTHPSA